MKVAIVCPYDLRLPGGVQSQASLLVEWLNDAGHRARLVGPGAIGADAVDVGRAIAVPINRSRAPVALSIGAIRRLRAALEGVDVVHVHEPFVPAIGLAALRTQAALVATFHADPPWWVRRGYRLGAPLLRRLLARVTVTTAVSPVAARAVADFATCRIVPNGVDVASFGVAGDKVPGRVVFVGRDEPRKGLDVLLRSWAGVRRIRPGASLVIVGSERTGLPAGVRALGRLSEEQKRAELAAAEVFCAPNTGGESFGIVLAEAMAARCAIVASDLPAFRELLGGQQAAGMVVRPADVAALTSSLVDVLGDRQLRARLTAAGTERVGAFDRAAVLGGYVRAYTDALGAVSEAP